jgi:hypothetical protein
MEVHEFGGREKRGEEGERDDRKMSSLSPS